MTHIQASRADSRRRAGAARLSGEAETADPNVPRSEVRLQGGAVSPETKAPAVGSGETAAGKEPDEAKGSE